MYSFIPFCFVLFSECSTETRHDKNQSLSTRDFFLTRPLSLRLLLLSSLCSALCNRNKNIWLPKCRIERNLNKIQENRLQLQRITNSLAMAMNIWERRKWRQNWNIFSIALLLYMIRRVVVCDYECSREKHSYVCGRPGNTTFSVIV